MSQSKPNVTIVHKLNKNKYILKKFYPDLSCFAWHATTLWKAVEEHSTSIAVFEIQHYAKSSPYGCATFACAQAPVAEKGSHTEK